MITILEGAPGHGKSYTLVREIAECVRKGKPVGTNVPLREDWAEVMAKWTTFLGFARKGAVQAKAREYERLVYITDDLDALLLVRFEGRGEGRGKLILDESHRDINARVRDKGRLRVVNHISAHRHYGMDVILATQDDMNLDRQVRTLAEWKSVVRNFRRLPIISILHVNIFLRVTRWNDRAKTRVGVTLYGLNKGLARLYDTHALEDKDWPEDAIVLPHPPVGVESRARKVAEGEPTPARGVIAFMDTVEPELGAVPNRNGKLGVAVEHRRRRFSVVGIPLVILVLVLVAVSLLASKSPTAQPLPITPVATCINYAVSGADCVGHESPEYERQERKRGETAR